MVLKSNNVTIDSSKPIVMGILNATPNSFFNGNRNNTEKEILTCAEKIMQEGGSIIDVGGYSTQPSASVVSEDDELKRVSDAIELILKRFSEAVISVDTFRSGVAEYVIKNYSVDIINDIGGGTLDNKMFDIIAKFDVSYILTHTRGTPQNMQALTQYDNVVQEVYIFLKQRINRLRARGVQNIIVDPGFGFAKTVEQNYSILKNLNMFQKLDVPLLAGLSRKSMLYKLLNMDAAQALNATTAANMLALVGGASILRVHNVKEAVEAVAVYRQYKMS